MSTIKLVLTDVDGTLVELQKNEASPSVVECIKQVQAAGVNLVAVTGRPYGMAKPVLEHLGFEGLCIVDAGATVCHVDTGEIVWKQWLSIEKLKELVTIMLPASTIIDFFPEFKEVDATTASVDDVVSEAPYVFAFLKEEQGDQVISALRQIDGININVHYHDDSWKGLINIQITAKDADKFHSVSALRRISHSHMDETLAIGDSSNDLPLFKAAGVKIAMGNAIDELKELADTVVADVAHDGFVEAMNEFVLKSTE